MRTTKELRERLGRAAAESGRSLAQEVEHIVEWHFNTEAFFKGVTGGEADIVIRPVINFIGVLGPQANGWKDKPHIANALRQGIAIIAEAAFANQPLSAKRQQEFLDPFWSAKDRVPAEIALSALSIAQQFGFAERFTPSPAREGPRK
jgi:hypothetical protein